MCIRDRSKDTRQRLPRFDAQLRGAWARWRLGRCARSARLRNSHASGRPAVGDDSGRLPKLRPLRALLPYLAPYRVQIALAILFLLFAAAATLALPYAVKLLVDGGLAAPVGAALGQRLASIREYFLLLFGVVVVLGLATAARFYMAVSYTHLDVYKRQELARRRSVSFCSRDFLATYSRSAAMASRMVCNWCSSLSSKGSC